MTCKLTSTIEFTVPSEMYGTTTCVVAIERYKQGYKKFPCGDGTDHKLTDAEENSIDRQLHLPKKHFQGYLPRHGNLDGYFLGIDTDGQKTYLQEFSWDCDWYWGGGYIETSDCHTHFDYLFLNKGCDAIDAIKEYFGGFYNTVLSEKEWWRLLDLMKQFYSHRKAAECFQYGGHCTSRGRTDKEINKEMAASINKHIETVIIPEVRKLLQA